MDANKQRVLLDVTAKYWQGYYSSEESETPFLRKWSGESLSRRIVERAMRLLDASIVMDSERSFFHAEYARDENTLHTTAQRDWNGIRLSILGIDTQSNMLPAEFQHVVQEATSNSLSLCILPSSYIEGWQEISASLREQERFTVPIFPIDLNALAMGRWSLLEMIEFKLYRICLLEKHDVESQFSESLFAEFVHPTSAQEAILLTDLPKVLGKLDDSSAAWADHPELERVVNFLRDGRDCILEGPSSSGKTILAFEAGLRLMSSGKLVKYADVGSVSPNALISALSNLRQLYRSRKDTLVIFDDLQSNPSVARYLLLITRLLRKAGSIGKAIVLAITWPSYGEEATKELPNALKIQVNPSETQRALLSKHKRTLSPLELTNFSEVAKNDVLLWRLLLEAPRDEKPTRADLANEIWSRRTKTFKGDAASLRRAVLVASLLGQYEFEFSDGFLEFQADISKSIIDAMTKARILRRVGDNLTIGHRSICLLLAQWLSTDDKIWAYLRQAGKPTESTEIIHTYIRTANVSEIWAILRKLFTQAGFKGRSEISPSAQILADAWKAIDSLIERIEQQQHVDPTWNKTLSSVLFAIEALCAVGKRLVAKPSIEFMRSKWSLTNNQFQIHEGTTERLDFDRIYEEMKQEDEIVGSIVASRETADQIDRDRYHHTWVMGLVLCSEAAYQERSERELQQMALAVEAIQEPDGNFYPRRVPWCTARVLEGLARCGRTRYNSRVVKKACDWLLRPSQSGGPYQDGVWESGTGAWNTTIETTAMCVIALIRAGIPPDDPKLIAALNYLISVKTEWTKSKHEIDGAWALRAYLALAGSPQEIIPQMQYLLKWARLESFWDSATKSAKESFDQSCRVAAITDYLIESTWTILRNDLPELLDAFAVSPLPVPNVATGTEIKTKTIGNAEARSERKSEIADISPVIFLCYARQDETQVNNIYQNLKTAGFRPWMDKKDILPGEKWRSSIEQAIRRSDFFLVCLSSNSVTKRGFVQKEIRDALGIWQEKLERDIYLIPVRLENCEAPETLHDFQWVDIFEDGGWPKLVRAIQVGMERQGKLPPPIASESFPKTNSNNNDGPLVQLCNQTSQKILLEYEHQISQLRLQMGELKSYQEKLNYAQPRLSNLEELERKKKSIEDRIEKVESLHTLIVVRLAKVSTLQDIENIYKDWKRELEN